MSLSQLYTLAKFPRVSGNTADRAKIATSVSNAEEIHIAISGASISQYVLKPSPKLVWSHSLPPSFVVTCVAQWKEHYVLGVYNKTKKSYAVQVIEKLENDSNVLKEMECGSRVIDVNFYENKILVVLEDSIICYDEQLEAEQWSVKSLYKSTYSQLVEKNVLLVVEHDSKKNNLNFKLLSMDGVEISSKIMEFSSKALDNLKFAYSNGVLYQYTTNALTLYKLPRFELLKTLNTLEIGLPEFTKASQLSFTSPSNDRLLISQDSELYLINTKFGIIISQVSSTTSTTTPTKKSHSEILYTQTASSSSSSQLFAVILRDSDIAGVTFTLDTNTLRDSLGKSHTINATTTTTTSTTTTTTTKHYNVPSILDIKSEETNIAQILQDYDQELLKYLHADQGYFTEHDRVIDSKFMNTIVSNLFNDDNDEIPERAMTYLLTHPLFPHVDGLLSKLRSKPRLLRQAVVTANISIEDLVQELNTTENEEIFKDVITRLLEFPKDKLNFKDLDTFKIVERILALNFGHELIALLIDSSGLFTWSDELIGKLQLVLEKKVESLNSASKALAVIEQVDQVKNLKVVQKVPVYSVEKLSI